MAAGRRTWFFPAVTAVVTTASGVAVNLATDAVDEPGAWGLVALCTLVTAALSVVQNRRGGGSATAATPATPATAQISAPIHATGRATVTQNVHYRAAPRWGGQLALMVTVVLVAILVVFVDPASRGVEKASGPPTGSATLPSPRPGAPTVTSIPFHTTCDTDVVVPAPPAALLAAAKVNPFPVTYWPDWPPAREGVQVSPGLALFSVQGTSEAQVVITDIRARVVDRRPAASGTVLTWACGDAGAYRWLEVDLDQDPPVVKSKVHDGLDPDDVLGPGDPTWSVTPVAFPYEVSLSDAETFSLVGLTTRSDVSWVVDVDWTSGGQHGTVTVDDGGRPFRTTSREAGLATCTFFDQSLTCS